MRDVIIIGAGPAGISAALWCDELGLDTLVIEEKAEIGGQLLHIYNEINDYLGVRAENGRALRDNFAAHIAARDFDLWTNAQIASVNLRAKKIELESGEGLQAINVIIATGVRRRRLSIEGEKRLRGRGVVESGIRDRDFLAGKDVCVVGGGDAAVENALQLADVCPTVTLVHRSKNLRARAEFVEKLKANNRITVFTEAMLQRIIGREEVEAVEILRTGALKPFQVAVRGVLIRIGVQPNTEAFRDQVHVDEQGYILVTREHETSCANVFAIGDVANPQAPTISGATGAGATAAKIISARLNNAGR